MKAYMSRPGVRNGFDRADADWVAQREALRLLSVIEADGIHAKRATGPGWCERRPAGVGGWISFMSQDETSALAESLAAFIAAPVPE